MVHDERQSVQRPLGVVLPVQLAVEAEVRRKHTKTEVLWPRSSLVQGKKLFIHVCLFDNLNKSLPRCLLRFHHLLLRHS